mmetsp:Transcript_67018/g.160243  ORF Transcript_67018/g.160243 Transcript_67018/m.160243 type:complete len:216 (+) Transcript_67018:409-1056(+)
MPGVSRGVRQRARGSLPRLGAAQVVQGRRLEPGPQAQPARSPGGAERPAARGLHEASGGAARPLRRVGHQRGWDGVRRRAAPAGRRAGRLCAARVLRLQKQKKPSRISAPTRTHGSRFSMRTGVGRWIRKRLCGGWCRRSSSPRISTGFECCGRSSGQSGSNSTTMAVAQSTRRNFSPQGSGSPTPSSLPWATRDHRITQNKDVNLRKVGQRTST